MNLAPYRKLVAALVGLALLFLNRYSGVDLGAHESAYVDLVLALATAAAVYAAPNDRSPEEKPDA